MTSALAFSLAFLTCNRKRNKFGLEVVVHGSEYTLLTHAPTGAEAKSDRTGKCTKGGRQALNQIHEYYG